MSQSGDTVGACGGRLEEALAGHADQSTLESLDWVVTAHIRSRFASADVAPDKVTQMAAAQPVLAAAPESLQPAAYFHFRLGELGAQYAEMRTCKRQSQQ